MENIKKETTIYDLSNSTLVEIFKFVPDIRPARLVSRKFREAIDDCRKLYSNYMLKLSKKISKDPSNILVKHYYEHVNIENLKIEELNILNAYKYKSSITALEIEMKKEALLKGYMLLQTVLYDFRFIKEISIDLEDSKENEENRDILEAKYGLRITELPALEILWMPSKRAKNMFYLFTKAPNLKKLTVGEDLEIFTKEATFELKELDFDIEETSTKLQISTSNFFQKHNSTLRCLRINYNNSLNFIADFLPDLEVLDLEHRLDYFEEDTIPNDNLKVLVFRNSEIQSESMERVLLHYNNIVELHLNLYDKRMEFKNIILPNLKHITVSFYCSPILRLLDMPVLESLSVGEMVGTTFIAQLPNCCKINIETLKIYVNSYARFDLILNAFPRLKHLYLMHTRNINENALNNILTAPNLETIHMIEDCWRLDRSSFEFLSTCDNKKLSIRLYPNATYMITPAEYNILNVVPKDD